MPSAASALCASLRLFLPSSPPLSAPCASSLSTCNLILPPLPPSPQISARRTAKSFDIRPRLSYNLQAITRAWVAKLADALDSGSSEQYVHVGSSPVPRTIVAARRIAQQLPGHRGAVCFYTLRLLFASQKCKTFTLSSFSASPQNCRSFTRFRSAGAASAAVYASKGLLCREETLPPLWLTRSALCAAIAIPSLRSLQVPSRAPNAPR